MTNQESALKALQEAAGLLSYATRLLKAEGLTLDFDQSVDNQQITFTGLGANLVRACVAVERSIGGLGVDNSAIAPGA
jgi:hypothetical protein